ncbi:hypothetical protein CRE_17638 [Caenorhabditis remanei]|uniref:Serine/threonine-protein phosphatase n=1 Tax=Caenorhabditis remanei TaxID=31234 RepID=E3NJQ5_CAERE|nr:hypothetical protein CRE_17638 [Caenorhabditis remanei]
MNDNRVARVKMLEKHFNCSNWKNGRSIGYTLEELSKLTDDATETFRRGPSLLEIDAPVTVVGDLHGQYEDLMRILMIYEKTEGKKAPDFTGRKYIFLGDYVDRGMYSLECIVLLLILKLHYPRQFFLIRGNHEMAKINYSYGFLDDVQRRFRKEEVGTRLWMKFNDVFGFFPVAGLIGKKVLCLHGGLSPELKSLDDIRRIQRPIHCVEENSLVADLLWSDPDPGKSISSISSTVQFRKNAVRGLSFTFNNAAIEGTLERLEIVFIVRAHQLVPDGFYFIAGKKLVTIFSASKYMSENSVSYSENLFQRLHKVMLQNLDEPLQNKGCVLHIRKDGGYSLLQLKGRGRFEEGENEEEDTRGDNNYYEADQKSSREQTAKVKKSKENKSKEKRSRAKKQKASKERSKQSRK